MADEKNRMFEYVVRFYDEILGSWKENRFQYEIDAANNATVILKRPQVHGLTVQVQDVTNRLYGLPGHTDPMEGVTVVGDVNLDLATLDPDTIEAAAQALKDQAVAATRTAAQQVLANPYWQQNPPTVEQFANTPGSSDVLAKAADLAANHPDYIPILQAVGADLSKVPAPVVVQQVAKEVYTSPDDEPPVNKTPIGPPAGIISNPKDPDLVPVNPSAAEGLPPPAAKPQSLAGNIWTAIEDVVDTVRTDLGKATTYVMVSLYDNFKMVVSRSRVESVLYAYGDALRNKAVTVFAGMNDSNAKPTCDYLVKQVGGDSTEVYNILFCLKEGADKGNAACGTIEAGTGLSVLDTVQHKGVTGAVAETVTSLVEGIGLPSWVGTTLLVAAVVGVVVVGYKMLVKPLVKTA